MNNENGKIIEDTARECFNVQCFIKKLSSRYLSETKQFTGHIHFHFRKKSDQIIFVWSMDQLKRIVAKSQHCKKNQYVPWGSSEFRDCKPEDVLGKFYNEIEYIETDEPFFSKKWLSYAEFIKWLIKD